MTTSSSLQSLRRVLRSNTVKSLLAALVLLQFSQYGNAAGVRLCGNQLVKHVRKVCSPHGVASPNGGDDGVRRVGNRNRHGIADRCCVSTCTLDDLKSFCKPPNTIKRSPAEQQEQQQQNTNVRSATAWNYYRRVKPTPRVYPLMSSILQALKDRRHKKEQ